MEYSRNILENSYNLYNIQEESRKIYIVGLRYGLGLGLLHSLELGLIKRPNKVRPVTFSPT